MPEMIYFVKNDYCSSFKYKLQRGKPLFGNSWQPILIYKQQQNHLISFYSSHNNTVIKHLFTSHITFYTKHDSCFVRGNN